MVIAVDRGRYTVLVGERTVTAMQARELGRRASSSATRSAWSATCPAARRAGPDRPGRPRRTVLRRTADDTDPYERVDRGQRRPAGHRRRAGRPAALVRADRPLPGRRLTRRARPAALPDQGRPRLAGRAAGRVRPPGRAGGRDPARRRPRASCGTGWPARRQRARRALRGRQVDAGQRAGPGRRAAPPARSARSARAGTPRPRWSRCRCRTGGWVDRHPGLRSFGLAHVTADDLLCGVPGPGGRRRAVPARLRAPVGRGRLPPGRVGGRGALDAGPARRVPPAAGEQVGR